MKVYFGTKIKFGTSSEKEYILLKPVPVVTGQMAGYPLKRSPQSIGVEFECSCAARSQAAALLGRHGVREGKLMLTIAEFRHSFQTNCYIKCHMAPFFIS